MYKKIIFSILVLFVSICTLTYELNNYCLATEKAEQNQKVVNKIKHINLSNIRIYKTAETLFASKSLSLENDIKNLDTKKIIQSIKINNDKITIIVLSDNDKAIIRFISDLYLKLNGLIKFDTIKFIKQKNKIKSKIEFNIICFDKAELKKSIKIYPQQTNIKPINIFKRTHLHTLLAVANKNQAFIDESWRKVGDTLDDDVILNVNQYSIKIKHEDEIITIHVGEKW